MTAKEDPELKNSKIRKVEQVYEKLTGNLNDDGLITKVRYLENNQKQQQEKISELEKELKNTERENIQYRTALAKLTGRFNNLSRKYNRLVLEYTEKMKLLDTLNSRVKDEKELDNLLNESVKKFITSEIKSFMKFFWTKLVGLIFVIWAIITQGIPVAVDYMGFSPPKKKVNVSVDTEVENARE